MSNPRSLFTRARSFGLALAAVTATAGLTACHASSKTSLGFRPNPVVQDEFAVTDSIGAALFSQHVQLAHAEAKRRRQETETYANVPPIQD